MGDVYVHVIGAVDEIWMEEMKGRGHKIIQEQKEKFFFFLLRLQRRNISNPRLFRTDNCRCTQRYWGQKTQCTHTRQTLEWIKCEGQLAAAELILASASTPDVHSAFVLSRRVSRSSGVIHAVNLEENWIFKRTTGRLHNLTVAISQPSDWEVTLCCVKVNVHYFQSPVRPNGLIR